MSLPLLQSIGITPTETSLYELLLHLGQTDAATLIKEAKIKRPTVYKALYSLEKKGLITQRDVKKKIHFTPASPLKLVELADKEYEAASQTRQNVQTLLPHLTSLYLTSVEQPMVKTYEGIDGIKTIYKDILKEKKPGYSIAQLEDMEPAVEEFLVTVFSKERARQKMPLKMILSSGKDEKVFRRRDIAEYRFAKTVPHSLFPFQQEVTVYGDKVAFMHYKKGDKLIGTIITHPQFAQTLKAWFDLAWEGAEKYK